MTNLKINGVEYDLVDGFLFNKIKGEELKSGTITIPFSDKLNLSPFDFVEITDERFGTEYFLIDTWVETTVSFNPLKYNYDINLIDETIKLQKVVMPNLTITQPISKTKKTISKKLDDYYNVYVKPQYPELELDNITLGNINEDSPEEEFNRPNAFEVFNTLLAKINSTVKIINNKICAVRLDDYGEEIDESKLYYNNDTQTIKDYANRLDFQVANGIAERDNFSTLSGITLRGGDNDAVFSDDNMVIKLEKPIYDFDSIAGVYVYFRYNYKNGESKGKAIANITDYIVEKSVYDTFLTSTKAGRLDNDKDDNGNIINRYKRNALYYVRGQDTIEGLNYSEKIIIGDSWIALYNILCNVTLNTDKNTLPDFEEWEVKDNVFFKVEYKTNDSYRGNVEKENKYNATLIDNQTEPQIDSRNFGKVEQDKLNRLGNKNQIITATYMRDEKIPQLGDYIGRYVLAQTEIVYYKDYCLFKGYLYKDFVRKNMFYGLNSKKRSTQISTESVIRNDIVNYNLSFILNKQNDKDNCDSLKRYVLYPLMMSDNADVIINGYDYSEFPKYAFIKTLNTSNDNIIKDDGWILLNTSTYSSGKSNIIHFQFKDNFSAGIRLTGNVDIKSNIFDKTVGGRKQEYVKYVDDYGEFYSLYFTIYSNKRKDFARIEEGADILEDIKPIADSLPLLSNEQANYLSTNANNLFGEKVVLYKDNRETTAISINLNYKDSENVIIGSFAENTGIGYHYIVRAGVYICYSTKYEYETGDEYGLGEMITDGSVSIDYTDGTKWLDYQENNVYPENAELDCLKLYMRNVDTSEWKSWGIVEASTNRLILGVNKGKEKTIPTKIYLKVEEKPY